MCHFKTQLSLISLATKHHYLTMRLSIVLLICFCILQIGLGQDLALSPRIANYNIELELDTTNKKILADQIVNWKNISEDTIAELYFHLYYNAFKNSESTFFKERGVPDFLTKDIDDVCGWGWSHIQSFVDSSGNNLISEAEYVAPDVGNEMDQTVMRIPLQNPIYPGQSANFVMQWEARIPRTMPRTGYNKDFYFLAQWFPKVGVYEPAGMRYQTEGAWNCHQYHSSGEYYSDFGVYDVKITVPEDFVVASSGLLKGQTKRGEKMQWHYVAEDVIDFTWTASPEFVVHEEEFGDTRILFYTYPYKTHVRDRYMHTIKFCMQYLQDHFGPYPYPVLSIVDPPIHGMYTGGMEYPTLITSLSFCFFPKGIRTPETLVVHEFIHQYFMQMVATHEVEDPWMDEGITTYYEGRILDALFGPDKSTIDIGGFHAGNAEYNRIEYFASKNPSIAPNTFKSYEFVNGGYGYISYNKTAVWLKTMEGILGQELMDQIMQTYFNRWKFKHPCRNDFTDLVNELIKQYLPERFPDGMDWYFEQVLFGTELCDYELTSLTNQKVSGPRGFLQSRDSCLANEIIQDHYRSKVVLSRLEGIQLPIECKIIWEDQSDTLINWDGQARTFAFESKGPHKIVAAIIDPDQKIYIDKNFINNSKTAEQQRSKLNQLSTFIMTNFQLLLESISFWV